MPELPEVETVRRGLADRLTGRQITAVEVLHPRPRPPPPGRGRRLRGRLAGRVFAEPRRRGKYLWLPLADGDAVLAHLGMSGQFRLEPTRTLRCAPNTRMLFDLRRRRARAALRRPADVRRPLPVAGRRRAAAPRSPTSAATRSTRSSTSPTSVARLRRKRTGIKRALLDQQLVSGIGNIYADEALWAARMHYARPTRDHARAQVSRGASRRRPR